MRPLESYFSFDAGEVVLLTVGLRPVVILDTGLAHALCRSTAAFCWLKRILECF